MLWTGVEGSPSQRPFLLSFSLLSGFTLLGQYHKYTWSFKRKSLVGYVYHSHAGYSLSVSGKTQNQGFRGRLFWVGQNTQPPTQCINSISCCRKKAVSLCLNSFFFKKSSLNLLHCCFWVFFFLMFWFFDYGICGIFAPSTRDGTCTPCTEGWSPSNWITKGSFYLNIFCNKKFSASWNCPLIAEQFSYTALSDSSSVYWDHKDEVISACTMIAHGIFRDRWHLYHK